MQNFPDNTVALLGTKGGPAIRPGSTMPTSSLISMNGQMAIVDCGLGVTRGLVDQGIDLKNISLIFITHLHSDHYLELGPFLHTAWTAGLNSQVEIFGPNGLDDYWRNFLFSMQADIDLRMEDEGRPYLADLVEVSYIDAGEIFESDAFSVTALRNIHPPLTETFALSFKSESHNVVFSGDTAFMPELADFAKGADLLVHEAMLEEGLEALVGRIGNTDDRLMKHLLRSHTFAQDAARLAEMAGVKKLALNHLIPSDDPDFTESDWKDAVAPHFTGEFLLGSDGMRIEI